MDPSRAERVRDDLKGVLKGEILFDDLSRTLYATDASVFEVRAINDRGVRDPNPARQPFKFRNNPPLVTLESKPNAGDRSETTVASATVTWTVSDADGEAIGPRQPLPKRLRAAAQGARARGRAHPYPGTPSD